MKRSFSRERLDCLDKVIFLYLVSVDICTETRALLINCSSVSCAYGLAAIVKSHLPLEDN